ncbi:hypothetical protein CHS0354_020891 [Potamilus streckersoni]|uniref:Uncharacterized protein n=1 Tax=Potamilus streckersoni TaxID=2493646 RepID=A0AAE0SWE6_9BIVA|nr:hypothetical protein CHS0354_020891 [Potamilus streckersoni]
MKCLRFYSIVILIILITLNSMCLARPADGCDRNQGLYLHEFLNGTIRCCKWVECLPGSEVIACQKPYTADHCQPCILPLVQPDKTNSELVVPCYRMPLCPEFSKRDETGQCQCDLDSGYYGELYYDCTYIKCPEGQQLTKWGYCTSKNVDQFPVKTTPGVKLDQRPNDTNDTFKPDSNKGNKDDPVEGIKNYITKISVNSFGSSATNDHSPEILPIPNNTNEAYSYITSFYYGMFGASVPLIASILVLGYFLYLWWKHKMKHANILELSQTSKGNEIFSALKDMWKPFPEGNLPLQLGFPGKSEFHKLPNIEPTPFASLPVKLEVGQSIGIIHMGNVPWGTGFVVGGYHIMTCFHTIYLMLGIKGNSEMNIEREITQLIHNVAISFHFNDAGSKNFSRFTFERCVPYFDVNLDVIVLKIDRSCIYNQILPMPLTKFCDFYPFDQFDFFGHPHGKEKQVDQYCRIKLVNASKIAEMEIQVKHFLIQKGFSPQHFYPPFHGMEDNNFYNFTTVFVEGGSGSPGIIYAAVSDLNSHSYAVGTMLCGGYPKFKPKDINHDDLDPEVKVQYGPKMYSVFKSMAQKNPALLRQVFQDIPLDWNEE